MLRFTPQIAPIKVAVLPLSKKLAEPAREDRRRSAPPLRDRLRRCRASIGKRYRRQDEVGTPFCVTYDFESEADQKATVRDRDTMKQERIDLAQLPAYLSTRILGY